MKVKSLSELNKLKREGEQKLFPRSTRIQVGTAPCGLSKGAQAVVTALQKELEKEGVEAAVVQVGCIGICYAEPTVEVLLPGKPKLTYGYITTDTIPSLVKALAKGKLLKKNLLSTAPMRKNW